MGNRKRNSRGVRRGCTRGFSHSMISSAEFIREIRVIRG
jgi:hypothetical protein